MNKNSNLYELPEIAKPLFSAIEMAKTENKEILVNFIASTVDDDAVSNLHSLNELTGDEQLKLLDYFNYWLNVRFSVEEVECISSNIQQAQFKLLTGRYAH